MAILRSLQLPQDGFLSWRNCRSHLLLGPSKTLEGQGTKQFSRMSYSYSAGQYYSNTPQLQVVMRTGCGGCLWLCLRTIGKYGVCGSNTIHSKAPFWALSGWMGDGQQDCRSRPSSSLLPFLLPVMLDQPLLRWLVIYLWRSGEAPVPFRA